jgi:hypothetical protein
MCTITTIILEFYALNVLVFIFNILYPNSIKEFHFVNNNVRDWTKILESYALNVLMFIFNILLSETNLIPISNVEMSRCKIFPILKE